MRLLSKVALLILFFSFSTALFAQSSKLLSDKKPKYYKIINLSFEQGAMLGNGTEIGDQLANSSYYNGVDFRLGFKKADYSDLYSRIHRLPVMGIGWYTSTFHHEAIGKPNAIYYFFNLPIRFEGSRKFTMSYLGAFGLSYNFNPYNEVTNPTDLFIGSKKNCYVNLALQLNYHFSPKWEAGVSAGFKHFSNGSFKQPNYGINLLPVAFSISYKPVPYLPYENNTPLPKFIRYNQYNVALMFGSKNYAEGEPNYLKSGLSLNWMRAVSYKHKVGVGMDIFYSAGVKPRTGNAATFGNSTSFAATAVGEWNLTKHLFVPMAVGIYLNRSKANEEETPYYERVGLYYRFNNNIHAGLSIKAHGSAADIFEWTIGYAFRKDTNKY